MKEKIIYSVMACLLGISTAMADKLIVPDVNIPRGGSIQVPVNYQFDAEGVNIGFQFNFVLPEGITLVQDEDGDPWCEPNTSVLPTNKYSIIAANNGFGALPLKESSVIIGTEGTLITIGLQADESLAIGTELTGKVENIVLSAKDATGTPERVELVDFTFKITVVGGTSINDINQDGQNTDVYNLAGQRVAKPVKGLYITEGKKIIKK